MAYSLGMSHTRSASRRLKTRGRYSPCRPGYRSSGIRLETIRTGDSERDVGPMGTAIISFATC